jgi:hypothetical protein
MPVFEVEVAAGPQAPPAAGLHFQPLQQTLRGRWELKGAGAKVENGALFASWPDTIPGQILGLDTDTGKAWVRDPLVEDPACQEVREKIKERGYQLPAGRQDKGTVDVATWVFWMGRAVSAGLARVIAGPMPKVVGKPRTQFILEKQEDPRDRTINRLLALVLETLPKEKRSRVEEIMDDLEA